MATFHDHRMKRILRKALASDGLTSIDEEVAAEPQRLDLWFIAGPAGTRRCTGLLRRMIDAPAMLEVFSRTPLVSEVDDCLREQMNWHHVLQLRRPAQRSWSEPPRLWIIAAGRPRQALATYRFLPADGWPRGVYCLGPAWNAWMIVLGELPAERDTLGRMLKRTVRELAMLRASVPEVRRDDVLLDLRKEVRKAIGSRRQGKLEDEHVSATRGFALALRRQGHEEGRKEAAEVLRSSLKTVYRARFGTLPPRIARGIEGVDDAERFSALVVLFATAAREEIAEELKRPRRSRLSRT